MLAPHVCCPVITIYILTLLRGLKVLAVYLLFWLFQVTSLEQPEGNVSNFFWRSYRKVVENRIPKLIQKRVQKRVQKLIQKPLQFCEKCDPKTDPKTDPKINRKDFPLKNFGSAFGSVFGSMFFATFWGHFFDRFLRNLWGNSFIKFWTSFCIRFTRFWIWLPVPSESFRKTGLHFESILALNWTAENKKNQIHEHKSRNQMST